MTSPEPPGVTQPSAQRESELSARESRYEPESEFSLEDSPFGKPHLAEQDDLE